MTDLVQLAKDKDIAIITINNALVNALSPGALEGISEALDEITRDANISAAVLIGGGRTLVAGADIKEFGKMTSGKSRGAGTSSFAPENRRRQKTGDRGDSRNGFWRRIGAGDGLATTALLLLMRRSVNQQ
jgi:enoyl-CoA hydratase/carnithine racemase